MAENIKLKDLYGAEQTYNGIDTVAIPKADGSGKAYFVKRPALNFTLQDPPAHEPAVTTGDFFVWNVGSGPLSGEYDDGNILGMVVPAIEGKTTKPILYISVSQPVSGVTVNASGDARLVYLYEELSGAMLKEVIDFKGTTDFTAEVGWGQLLLDDSGSVTGYAKITEPGGVVIGILQPMGVLNADVFYAAFSETTQESQSVEVTENGSQTIVPTAGKSGIRKVALNVNVPSSGGNLQEKSVSITSNGTTEVTPDAGYDGMSKVKAVVNVAGGGGNVQANWAQNDSTAADYVKNRPGGYFVSGRAAEILTFDGNLEGKTTVALEGGAFVKVSDDFFYAPQLYGGSIETFVAEGGASQTETESLNANNVTGNSTFTSIADLSVLSTTGGSAEIAQIIGVPLPAGTWFLYAKEGENMNYTKTLTIPDTTNSTDLVMPIRSPYINLPVAGRNTVGGVKVQGGIASYGSFSDVCITTDGVLKVRNYDIQEFDAIILRSSTLNSTKKFKITVDDTGTLKATEVTT